MRGRLLALAGLLALPSLAAAQLPDLGRPPGQLPDSRFALTPFVGIRIPYTTDDEFVFTEGGPSYRVEETRGGGLVGGVEVEARAWGPLRVLGSLAYGASGDHDITLTSSEGDVTGGLGVDAPQTWLGKLALAYRLPEPRPDNRRFHPAAFVSAGPSLVRMDFEDDAALGTLGDATHHWGVNLGIHTAAAIGSRVAIHLGLEDYLTFWDTDRLAEREAAIYSAFLGREATVDFDGSSSNLLMLRAGVSIRLQ
ncbi:MAG TPA: hypothetical protein VHG28_07805 [Longimicrobiaceae bacterium]|nr:hypothetical protein [Longimicrobiaceae bacterium]